MPHCKSNKSLVIVAEVGSHAPEVVWVFELVFDEDFEFQWKTFWAMRQPWGL